MTVGRDSSRAVAGGPARHIPVLSRAAVELLAIRDGGVYVDATFGAGGYAREMLAAANCRVIGIDRDRTALMLGRDLVVQARGRLVLIQDRFSRLDAVARASGFSAVDGVVLDLGVSSMQLDTPARGFSFRHEGPLDMRMSEDGVSAADIVARADERALATIIATLGEEKHARAVARAIVKARQKAPIATTRALAEVVASAVPSRAGAIHPATRTFQALRMMVNDELRELSGALLAAERVLRPGGRLVVVSFHSLEDRLVKTFLVGRSAPAGVSRHAPELRGLEPSFRLLTRRPLRPDAEEITRNPRARSAKLRAAERLGAPARDEPPVMPRLPALEDIARER